MIVLFLFFFEKSARISNGISILFSTVHQFIFLPTVYEGSLFFTCSPIFVISCLFINGHSNKYEVVSYGGFKLHFPDNQWCWISFHVPVDYLHVIFGLMIYSDPLPIFKKLYIFFTYFEYFHSLSYIVNIFSHPVGCFLMMISFTMQKLFNLM